MRLLATGQRDRGHAVRVAAVVDSTASEHPFLKSLDDAGIEADVLAIPDRAYLREVALVRDLCRRYHPAIVHTHGFRPDVLDAAVARRMGVPTVTTVHGFTGGGWKVEVYERIQRFAFRWFDAVVAVSRPLANELAASGVPRQRIHTVPNAYAPTVDPADRATARRKLGLSDDAFTVGWVGRLSHEKGPDVLIDALGHLTDLPTKVSMVGAGPAREALGARAVALGVGERITWHGVVGDAASLFRAFDVFVLSSRTEGSPMVLFEAMAAGVPVVASEVGGVPDTLSGAEAALVPPDDPRALANAIRDVHGNRERAAAGADAARKRLVADFSVGPWLARYEELYRQIQHPHRERES